MTTLMTGGITAIAKPVSSASPQRIRPAEPVVQAPATTTVAAAYAAPSPAQSVGHAQAAVSGLEEVQRALDRLKQSIKPTLANSLEFQIDQSSGKTVVKILDAETSAVVRQIPSEELLTIARALDRMQGNGGLVRQQA